MKQIMLLFLSSRDWSEPVSYLTVSSRVANIVQHFIFHLLLRNLNVFSFNA